MTDRPGTTADQLLDAALMHVPFDGWSETSLRAAATDCGISRAEAKVLFPRGAVDMAIAFHQRGDQLMLDRIAASDLEAMRFRDRVAAAVRFRLEAVDDKEAVRRGTTLFSLPQHVPDGAKAVWGTADLIWTALGDSSDDANWYTKRATLSAVYSSTVLFWLGDDSLEHQATWDFLDRRIDNVMQIEKLKARVNKNPLLKPLMAGPNWLMSAIKPPRKTVPDDLPGQMRRP